MSSCKRTLKERAATKGQTKGINEPDTLKVWLGSQREEDFAKHEAEALAAGFGSELERTIVLEEKAKGVSMNCSGRIRQEYVRRFMACDAKQDRKMATSG
jgi:hypothetical protein